MFCCCSLAGTAACLTCPNRTVLPNPAMWHETNIPSQKGWECPVCGMVMAPWMPYCTKCPTQITWATSSDGPDGKLDCVLGVMQQDKCDLVADWECAYCGKDCRAKPCIGRANLLRKD